MKAFFLFLIAISANAIYSQKELQRPPDTANKAYSAPQFNVKFSAGHRKTCAGKSIRVSDSTGGTNLKHQWSVWPPANFAAQDSSSAVISIQFNKPGRYNITKISKDGLLADTFTDEDIIIFDTLGKAACIPKTFDSSNSTDYGITYVGLANISQLSKGTFISGSYEDFSCHTLGILKPGKKYLLSAKVSDTNAQFIKIYIDFNNDGLFSESTELVNSYYSAGLYKDSITIPWNVVFNKTLRMRVLADYVTPSNACDDLFYGQAEDYSVVIEYEKAAFSVNKKTACVNETIVFIDSSHGIFNTYEWDFGSGAIPSTASGKGPHQVTYPKGGYKRVSLDLNNGLHAIIDSAVFIVPSETEICTSNGRDTFCPGDELRISLCRADSKNTDYKWYKDNVLLSATGGMLLIKNCKAGDAGSYTVNAKNECRNDTSGILKIVVPDAPNAAMSVDKTQACLDSANFDLINLSNIGSGRMSYKWEISDGRTFTDSNLQISFNQSGKFRVRLISKNSGFCADTAGIDLTVYPLPSAKFRVKPEADLAYRFTPDSIQYKSYFWDFGDGDTSWQLKPLHKFSIMSNYKISLEVHSMAGCRDSVQAYLYKLLTSIDGIEKSILYSIQPNPNNGRFSLIINLPSPAPVTVDLVSSDGKIHPGIINGMFQENRTHIQFDLEALGLDSGLYLMCLKIGEETYFARISYLR
jgi:PKD repeat protein